MKEELLKVAAQLLQEGGEAALTMENIAQAAGTSRATVYRVVGSRQALMGELAGRGLVDEEVDVSSRVLRACTAVFSRAGVEAATVEEIAREAGVGVATIYRHFGTREGLVDAFVSNFGQRRAAREVSLNPSGDLRTDLLRMTSAALEDMAAHPDISRLGLMEALKGSVMVDRLKQSPYRGLPTLVKLLTPHLRGTRFEQEDPTQVALCLAGMLMAFGVFGPTVEKLPLTDPHRAAELMVDLFLSGVFGDKVPGEMPS